MTWESTLLGIDSSPGVDAAMIWAITSAEIHRRMERRGTPLHRARTVRRVEDPEAPGSMPNLDLSVDHRLDVPARDVVWFRFEGDLANLLAVDDLWAVCGTLLEGARLRWLLVWARQNGASLSSYLPATWVESGAAAPAIDREGGLWSLTAPDPSRGRRRR